MKPVLPWYLKPSRWGCRSIALVLFTLPFLILGVVFGWQMSGQALCDWWQARHWVPANAVIQTSWLEIHKGDEDDGYKVAAKFTYSYGGQTYESMRPSFVHNWTNLGVSSMRETVRQLEPGKKVACWVNPANPAEAVLDRSLPAEAILGFFFSIPFLTVGSIGPCILALPLLRRSLRQKRLEQLRPLIAAGKMPAWLPDMFKEHAQPDHEGTTLVIAQDERVIAALALTCFNLFWNGIVAVFVCAAVTLFVSGDTQPAVLLSLFLTPFIAIGTWLLWKWSKHLRLARRPRWAAVVRPTPAFAGGETELWWAWLKTGSAFPPPRASLRLVALAVQWDDESDQPSETLGRRHRAPVTHPAATQRGELELAAVDIPVQDASSHASLRSALPPVAAPNSQLHALATPKSAKLAQLTWGGWWQLEVTHADGEVETAKLMQPVKFE